MHYVQDITFRAAPQTSTNRVADPILPCPYICRRCGCVLTPFNIRPNLFRYRGYICGSCYSLDMKEVSTRYYQRHRSKVLEKARQRRRELTQQYLVNPWYLRKKQRALQAIVAGGFDKVTGREELKCANCGCDDIMFLQVNHLNGNGNREIKSWHGKIITIPDAILRGRRSVHDLNILCAVCNILEYLKRRYPGRDCYPEIVWRPELMTSSTNSSAHPSFK